MPKSSLIPSHTTVIRIGSGWTLLVVALLTLKAMGHLSWGWLTIVLLPIWLPLVGLALILACLFAVALVTFIIAFISVWISDR